MAFKITLVRAIAEILMFARQGTTTALDASGVTGGSVQADAQRVLFDTLYQFAASGDPGFLYKAESFTADSNGAVTISDDLVVKVVGAAKHDGVEFRILDGKVFHGNTSNYFRANETVLLNTYRLPDTADTANCFEKLDPATQRRIISAAKASYRAMVSFDPQLDAVVQRERAEFVARNQRTTGSKVDYGPEPLGGSFGGNFERGGGRGGNG